MASGRLLIDFAQNGYSGQGGFCGSKYWTDTNLRIKEVNVGPIASGIIT